MPRKPKPSSTPATSEDVSTASPRDAPLDSLARPQAQLRRSGRLLTNSKPLERGKSPSGRGDMLGIRPNKGEDMDEKDVAERGESVRADVQLAIEGLVNMERHLKSATKRQKLQVEETRFSEPREENRERSVRITQPGKVRSTEPTRQGQGLRSDKDSFDRDITEGQGLDLEMRRIDAPEEAPDVSERGAARAPPLDSDYLPLPWKGRLGYACLNTYLRTAKPPVFCSRTCRMSSILDHRYPLTDPSQPEHAVKNRPDKSKEPSTELGNKFLQELGLANARDLARILRWNEKYGIRFFRLSSDMFPFASHPLHGYKLAPFASEVLAEAGKVAAEFGHRLTTHPGQYTQLGSPREEVILAAIRDLEYHDEMLSLLRLPEQQNRDAIMILHMGGTYGDKAATLDRFRKNYARLSPSIKARLVLENDDVAWSVHDLLPICEELNIPLVLDYHHHNIIFDSTKCREGTYDISQPEIQERIAATWRRKGIKQKMHYSEACPGAVTPRDRRKHSPRVSTLPPCPPDMDLMIEAKDKEQAVFELMRIFKLPGFEKINDMIPHQRDDEYRPAPKMPKKRQKPAVNLKRKRAIDEEAVELNELGAGAEDEFQSMGPREVSEEEFGMGGPLNRVYWPPGKEDWLKPQRKGAVSLMLEQGEDSC
ncbi:hypothetical protein VTK56DRAFT_10186 [Thermocarpiscus australiensis]